MSTDLLYYIMDYSENYYRVNKEEQLVVAAGKEETTVFTFSQANSKISVGKKIIFLSYDSGGRGKWIVRLWENWGSVQWKWGNLWLCSGRYFTGKKLTRDEVHCSITKNPSSYDLSEMDWEEYLTHFAYEASNLTDYKDELTKKQSEVDQKICDVLHYIGLCETDDNEATDLVELLRVCGENRREIKDELFENSNMHKAKANTNTTNEVNENRRNLTVCML